MSSSFSTSQVGSFVAMVTFSRSVSYTHLDVYKRQAVFGGVRVREVDGYYVLTAQRRALHYAEKKVKPRKG